DILRRDLHDVVARPGTRECVIASGTLLDPYTGTVVDFVRGPDSDDVQIDHVVALSDAWAKGARHLEPQRRVDLANDPLNRLAVDGPPDRAKGSADASRWLPPDPAAHCDYAARQVAVKLRYQLWVSPDEKAALDGVLRSCPGQ